MISYLTKENIKKTILSTNILKLPITIKNIPLVINELNTLDDEYKNKLYEYLYILFKLPFNLSKIVDIKIIDILLNRPTSKMVKIVSIFLHNIKINGNNVTYFKKGSEYFILYKKVSKYIYYEILAELSKLEKIELFIDDRNIENNLELLENIKSNNSLKEKYTDKNSESLENIKYKDFLKDGNILKNYKIKIITNQALLSFIDKKLVFELLFSELKEENNILNWDTAKSLYLIIKNSDKSYFNNFKEIFKDIFCREILWINSFLILSMFNYESKTKDTQLEIEDIIIYSLNYFKRDKIASKLRETALFYIYTSKYISKEIYYQVISTAIFDPNLNCRRAAATIITTKNTIKSIESKIANNINFFTVKRYENIIKKYFFISKIIENDLFKTFINICFYFEEEIQINTIDLFIKYLRNKKYKGKFTFNKKIREINIDNKIKIENIEETSFIIFIIKIYIEFYNFEIKVKEIEDIIEFSLSTKNNKNNIDNNKSLNNINIKIINTPSKNYIINLEDYNYLLYFNIKKYKNNTKITTIINLLYNFYYNLGYINYNFIKNTINLPVLSSNKNKSIIKKIILDTTDNEDRIYNLISYSMSTPSILLNRNNIKYSKEIFKRIISSEDNNKIEQLRFYVLPKYTSNFYYRENNNYKSIINYILEININSYRVGVEDIGYTLRKEALISMITFLHPLLPNYFIKLLADKSKGLRDEIFKIIKKLLKSNDKIFYNIKELKKEFKKYENEVKVDISKEILYNSFYDYTKEKIIGNYNSMFNFIKNFNCQEEIFTNCFRNYILLNKYLKEEFIISIASTIKNSTRNIFYSLIKECIPLKKDIIFIFLNIKEELKDNIKEYINIENNIKEKHLEVKKNITIRKLYLSLTLISILLSIETKNYKILDLDENELENIEEDKTMIDNIKIKEKIERLTKIEFKRIKDLAEVSLKLYNEE